MKNQSITFKALVPVTLEVYCSLWISTNDTGSLLLSLAVHRWPWKSTAASIGSLLLRLEVCQWHWKSTAVPHSGSTFSDSGSLLLPLEIHQSQWKSTAASISQPITLEVYCCSESPSMALEVYCCLWKSTNDPRSLLLPLEVCESPLKSTTASGNLANDNGSLLLSLEVH